MNAGHSCETCGMNIELCEECGGYMCADGCPDRADDGCECDVDELEDGDTEADDSV